jgi:predicted nucleic acid-binding protein
MTRYLLDADAIIDMLRGFSDSAGFINGLYQAGDTLCTCDVVVAEVFAGLHATHREQGRELLESMRFLTTSPAAARQAGLWRYEFRSRGIQLSTTDCLIAAIALDRRATIITGNVRDYPMPDVDVQPLPRRC